MEKERSSPCSQKPVTSTLRQINLFHTPIIILLSVLIFSAHLHYVFQANNVVQFFFIKPCRQFSTLACVPHALPFLPLLPDHPSDIWWLLQIMELLIKYLSLVLRYSVLLKFKYFLQHSIVELPLDTLLCPSVCRGRQSTNCHLLPSVIVYRQVS